jgi:UDP-3-O-acyl-N-acetylglucosamine deacetylase
VAAEAAPAVEPSAPSVGTAQGEIGEIGAFSARKSGHALNNRLLTALLADHEAWEIVTFEGTERAPISFTQPVEVA